MSEKEELKRAEGRGYSRGYYAGRQRLESEIDRELKAERERQRYDAYFCAALTGLIQNGQWRTGDKVWASMDDYVRGAADFAMRSLNKNRFLP